MKKTLMLVLCSVVLLLQSVVVAAETGGKDGGETEKKPTDAGAQAGVPDYKKLAMVFVDKTGDKKFADVMKDLAGAKGRLGAFIVTTVGSDSDADPQKYGFVCTVKFTRLYHKSSEKKKAGYIYTFNTVMLDISYGVAYSRGGAKWVKAGGDTTSLNIRRFADDIEELVLNSLLTVKCSAQAADAKNSTLTGTVKTKYPFSFQGISLRAPVAVDAIDSSNDITVPVLPLLDAKSSASFKAQVPPTLQVGDIRTQLLWSNALVSGVTKITYVPDADPDQAGTKDKTGSSNSSTKN